MCRAYHLKPSWRITLIVCSILIWLLLLFPYIVGLKVTGSFAGNLIAFALIFLFGVWGMAEALTDRVITSPNGIEYISILYRISTTWDNVEHIEMNRYGLVNLTLFRTVMKTLPPISWYLRLFGYDRVIALSPFVANWQTSELLQQIHSYVPDILTNQLGQEADDKRNRYTQN